jgi:hypothetical protein
MPPPCTAEWMKSFDPSEAIAGPELKRLLPERFHVVERRGFGGTLLSYMSGLFDFDRCNRDPAAAKWLRILIEIERAVIDSGVLDDDFVLYVAAKRRTGR